MATNLLIPQDGTLTLGPSATATDVSCQVSNASIVATPQQKTITTLCGVSNAAGITSFVLHVEAAPDWAADGISTFLWENDGQVVDFSLTPTASGQPTATGQCYVAPGSFSGASGEIATLTVDLGTVGKPTITPPVTAFARDTDVDRDDDRATAAA
jgi:hypothetical protein